MIDTALAHTTTVVALPGILDPINVLSWFGAWAFWGLLLVVFIESGVLFPVLPGDSLLFVAGMVVAAGGKDGIDQFASLWQLLVFVPIAAILGDQLGYFIGRRLGRGVLEGRLMQSIGPEYVARTHAYFERFGPLTVFFGRFIGIVRTLTPVVAGFSGMPHRVFTMFSVAGSPSGMPQDGPVDMAWAAAPPARKASTPVSERCSTPERRGRSLSTARRDMVRPVHFTYRIERDAPASGGGWDTTLVWFMRLVALA